MMMGSRNPSSDNMGMVGNMTNQFSLARKNLFSELNPVIRNKTMNIGATEYMTGSYSKQKKGVTSYNEDDARMYFQNHAFTNNIMDNNIANNFNIYAQNHKSKPHDSNVFNNVRNSVSPTNINSLHISKSSLAVTSNSLASKTQTFASTSRNGVSSPQTTSTHFANNTNQLTDNGLANSFPTNLLHGGTSPPIGHHQPSNQRAPGSTNQTTNLNSNPALKRVTSPSINSHILAGHQQHQQEQMPYNYFNASSTGSGIGFPSFNNSNNNPFNSSMSANNSAAAYFNFNNYFGPHHNKFSRNFNELSSGGGSGPPPPRLDPSDFPSLRQQQHQQMTNFMHHHGNSNANTGAPSNNFSHFPTPGSTTGFPSLVPPPLPSNLAGVSGFRGGLNANSGPLGPYVNMIKQDMQQPEFHIHKEDFPALSGPKGKESTDQAFPGQNSFSPPTLTSKFLPASGAFSRQSTGLLGGASDPQAPFTSQSALPLSSPIDSKSLAYQQSVGRSSGTGTAYPHTSLQTNNNTNPNSSSFGSPPSMHNLQSHNNNNSSLAAITSNNNSTSIDLPNSTGSKKPNQSSQFYAASSYKAGPTSSSLVSEGSVSGKSQDHTHQLLDNLLSADSVPGGTTSLARQNTAANFSSTASANLIGSTALSTSSRPSANPAGTDIAISNPDRKGVQTLPDGRITEIPASMIKDQFGMVGLLRFIRSADAHPELVQLGLGSDLTTFGLDLNSSEPLYQTFSGPFEEKPCKAYDLNYPVPNEYLFGSIVGEKLPPMLPNKLGEELLFYLFYTFPNDLTQLVAAQELYDRDWRFHTEDKIWLTKIPGLASIEKTLTYERGTYYYFDAVSWRKHPKEFLIYYNKLEEKPGLPPTLFSAFRLINGSGPVGTDSAADKDGPHHLFDTSSVDSSQHPSSHRLGDGPSFPPPTQQGMVPSQLVASTLPGYDPFLPPSSFDNIPSAGPLIASRIPFATTTNTSNPSTSSSYDSNFFNRHQPSQQSMYPPQRMTSPPSRLLPSVLGGAPSLNAPSSGGFNTTTGTPSQSLLPRT